MFTFPVINSEIEIGLCSFYRKKVITRFKISEKLTVIRLVYEKMTIYLSREPSHNRDRGGGGAGRAIALPLFCLG